METMSPLNKPRNDLKLAKMEKAEWKDSLHLNDMFLISLMFTAKQKSTSSKISCWISQPQSLLGWLLSLVLSRPGCIQQHARVSQSPGCSFSHLTPAGILVWGSFSFLFSLCLLLQCHTFWWWGGWNQQGGGKCPSSKAGRRLSKN